MYSLVINLTDENTSYFTRELGDGRKHRTPRLPKKKGETTEEFFKRMNELGYGNGDLEKVPHHWNGDESEMHPGTDSESCRFCKPTKRQTAKLNKEKDESSEPSEGIKESTPEDKSSKGGSETSEAAEVPEKEKEIKVTDAKLPDGSGATVIDMPDSSKDAKAKKSKKKRKK